MHFFILRREISREIWRKFYGIFLDPQNKGSKIWGGDLRAFFVRKLVPRNKSFVTSFCRRATLSKNPENNSIILFHVSKLGLPSLQKCVCDIFSELWFGIRFDIWNLRSEQSRVRKISPKFSSIKFFQIRDVRISRPKTLCLGVFFRTWQSAEIWGEDFFYLPGKHGKFWREFRGKFRSKSQAVLQGVPFTGVQVLRKKRVISLHEKRVRRTAKMK